MSCHRVAWHGPTSPDGLGQGRAAPWHQLVPVAPMFAQLGPLAGRFRTNSGRSSSGLRAPHLSDPPPIGPTRRLPHKKPAPETFSSEAGSLFPSGLMIHGARRCCRRRLRRHERAHVRPALKTPHIHGPKPQQEALLGGHSSVPSTATTAAQRRLQHRASLISLCPNWLGPAQCRRRTSLGVIGGGLPLASTPPRSDTSSAASHRSRDGASMCAVMLEMSPSSSSLVACGALFSPRLSGSSATPTSATMPPIPASDAKASRHRSSHCGGSLSRALIAIDRGECLRVMWPSPEVGSPRQWEEVAHVDLQRPRIRRNHAGGPVEWQPLERLTFLGATLTHRQRSHRTWHITRRSDRVPSRACTL